MENCFGEKNSGISMTLGGLGNAQDDSGVITKAWPGLLTLRGQPQTSHAAVAPTLPTLSFWRLSAVGCVCGRVWSLLDSPDEVCSGCPGASRGEAWQGSDVQRCHSPREEGLTWVCCAVVILAMISETGGLLRRRVGDSRSR